MWGISYSVHVRFSVSNAASAPQMEIKPMVEFLWARALQQAQEVLQAIKENALRAAGG